MTEPEPVTDTSTTVDNNNDGDDDIGLYVAEALKDSSVRPDILVALITKISEKTYKKKYETLESDFKQMKINNNRLKSKVENFADVERAMAGDGFAMDNIMFRHMCNAALSTVYSGMCAAFLQTDVESLPQGIFFKEEIVDSRGEVVDVEGFWQMVPYLFDLKLKNIPRPRGDGMNRSIYELLTGVERAKYDVRGEYEAGQTGKLFYMSFNDEVVESDQLSKRLRVEENLLRFLRNMRARIYRRVKQLRRDFKEASDRHRRLQEDLTDIRKRVDKLVYMANQLRKARPVFVINSWIEEYDKRNWIAPRADAPVPSRGTAYDKHKFRAQKLIVYELLPKMKSSSEAQQTYNDLKEKLPRMENYLYLTTIALRLLREKDVVSVLVNSESAIWSRLRVLGNASAHPLNYRPRIGAALGRLHHRVDLTEAEQSLVMKMATILGAEPPDSFREFEFWYGNYKENPHLPENALGAFRPPGPDLQYYNENRRDRGLRESNLLMQQQAGGEGSESPTWPRSSLPVRPEAEVEPVTIAPGSSHGPPLPSSHPPRSPNQFTPPVSVAMGLPAHPLLESLSFGRVRYDSSSGGFSVSSQEDVEEAGEEKDAITD